MEKVINFDALKANRAERKEKRAEKKAERKAKREAGEIEKKPILKVLGFAGSCVASAGAGAAVATAIIKMLNRNDAPIEMADPEVPAVENSVQIEMEVDQA